MKKSLSALLSAGILLSSLAPAASAESVIENQQSNYDSQYQLSLPSFATAATSSSWNTTLAKGKTANSKSFKLDKSSTVTISIDQHPTSGKENVKFRYTLKTVSGNSAGSYDVNYNTGDKYGDPAQNSWKNVLPGTYVIEIVNIGDITGSSDGDVYTTASN
ncbi:MULTISPECIES: hypothetical protein [Paenibacillus]|uniref:Uncharacterized protein n=1 Tax=Paenibacillus borealis TaxID=160799 RepID=A0ABX3HKP8_PAEBO|nr:hypothetical protein [Paenibacillus borealis]OMD50794.1 hypothetical protein BSK56_06425 [Paenibacillus borealis]